MTTPNDDLIEQAARYAYEDAYPGKPWGMADTFTASMFKQKAAYYAPVFGRLIAKPEAERDAATKTGMGIMMSEQSRQAAERVKRALIAEGERRATAAIVAWLFDRSALADKVSRDKWWTLREAAASIERGDHITEAKP